MCVFFLITYFIHRNSGYPQKYTDEYRVMQHLYRSRLQFFFDGGDFFPNP